MKRKKLGELITISKGKKHLVAEKVVPSSKRIIGITDLRNDNNIVYTNDKNGTEVIPVDIMIAWDGANAGTIGFGKSGYIGSTIARLSFKEKEKFHTAFVGTFLKTQFDYLRKTTTGATIPHISRSALEGIRVPLLTIDDQIRIATLLSRVEALIATRKASLSMLDEFLKSTFLEMFGDPVRNEKGWGEFLLEHICSNIVDCPHSTPEYSDVKTNYFCIRSSDIVNGQLKLTETKHVSKATYENRISRYTPIQGDIAYTREGGRLGNAALIPSNSKICLGQRIMLFKTDAKICENVFLWAILESESFKHKIMNLVGGGAAPRINIKDLRKQIVFLPPIDLQSQFARIVEKTESLKTRYLENLNDLENLYGTLSQKAFTGELDLTRVPLNGNLLNADGIG